MKDRVVEHPNRFRLVKVPGETDVYDLVPVPGEVTEPGTPLNKAALLSDTVGQKYGLDSAGTISQALEQGTTVRELTVGTNWVADGNIVKQEILAPWSKATFSAVFGLQVSADIDGDREQFAKILEDGLIFEDGFITVRAIEPTEKEITIRIKGV